MKKLLALLLCCASFSAVANGRCLPPNPTGCTPPPAIPVLMYHKVTTAEPPSDLVVSPRMFTAHIDAIRDAGYKTITVSQLVEYMRGERAVDPKTVVITFDDGWRDNLSAAMNMKDRGMVGTFFVMSSVWDNAMYLTQEELKLIAAYHEIGGHTHTHFMEWHDKLDKMDDRIMVGEMLMSKILIERVIGKPVKSFAWPFGYSRQGLNTMLTAAGYTSAVHVNSESNNTVDGDPMVIQRIAVNGGCTPNQLIKLIEQRKLGVCNEKAD